jgi:hypothetical protein
MNNKRKMKKKKKKWATESNRTFSKEEVQMAGKQCKKCSPSLAIKKDKSNHIQIPHHTY